MLTPYLCARNAAAAVEYYKDAFGAVEIARFMNRDGRIGHVELQIAGAPLYLSDEFPEIDVLSPQTIGGSPVLIYMQVPDCDAVFNRAVALGARVDRPLADQFDGAMRTGKLIDPFGHRWMISTVRQGVTSRDLQKNRAE